MIRRDVWQNQEFVGLPAIARRMNLNRETILKMHYNASSPELSFPMFKIPFKNPGSWTTSNFLIYEWEIRMAKQSYKKLRVELGLESGGRQDVFKKLTERWKKGKSRKLYKSRQILRKMGIFDEKLVYPGVHVRDQKV